jgi:hypothetical protein
MVPGVAWAMAAQVAAGKRKVPIITQLTHLCISFTEEKATKDGLPLGAQGKDPSFTKLWLDTPIITLADDEDAKNGVTNIVDDIMPSFMYQALCEVQFLNLLFFV